MNESKLMKSFQLVKEDIGDLYVKVDELTERADEMRISLRILADKLVLKVNKPVRKAGKKKTSKKKVKKTRIKKK